MEANVCVLVHVLDELKRDEGAEYPEIYDVDKLFDGNIIVPETVNPPLQVTNPEHVKVDESVSPVVEILPNV